MTNRPDRGSQSAKKSKSPNGHKPPPSDPASEMPGDVMLTPDRMFGFEAVGRTDHPGACVYVMPDTGRVAMSKGTDGDKLNWRYRAHYVLVEANEAFGLSKLTAFSTRTKHIKIGRIMLFYPERHIGRLDDAIVRELQWASGEFVELKDTG
jgi:hypothetical protein